MVLLAPLFSRIPTTPVAIPIPQTLSQASLFLGEGLGEPIWIAQLPEIACELSAFRAETPVSVSGASYFVSANGLEFHQLRISVDHLPRTPQGLTKMHPLVTLTPGISPLALDWSGLGLELLFNDPEDTNRLVRVPLDWLAPGEILQRAAFHVYPEGEPPALIGALETWCSRNVGPLISEMTPDEQAQFLRGVGHDIANGMAVLAPNISFALAGIENLEQAAPEGEAGKKIREFLKELKSILKDFEAANGRIGEASTRMTRRVPSEYVALAEVLRHRRIPKLQPTNGNVIKTPLLYVEDEIVVGESTQRMLLRLGFQNVLRVTTAAEAEAILRDRRDVRIILSDHNLDPGSTGLKLSRRVLSLRPELLFLFLSGNPGEVVDQMTPEERERFAVLTKPVDFKDLAQKLRTLFSTPSPK